MDSLINKVYSCNLTLVDKYVNAIVVVVVVDDHLHHHHLQSLQL